MVWSVDLQGSWLVIILRSAFCAFELFLCILESVFALWDSSLSAHVRIHQGLWGGKCTKFRLLTPTLASQDLFWASGSGTRLSFRCLSALRVPLGFWCSCFLVGLMFGHRQSRFCLRNPLPSVLGSTLSFEPQFASENKNDIEVWQVRL